MSSMESTVSLCELCLPNGQAYMTNSCLKSDHRILLNAVTQDFRAVPVVTMGGHIFGLDSLKPSGSPLSLA